MELRDAIIKRKSVRRFVSHKDIDDFTIKSIIDLGLKAPSAGNLQPFSLFVIRNPKTKRKLEDAAFGQKYITTAPVVFVVCVDKIKAEQRYGDRGRDLYCIQDSAAFIQNMLLVISAKNLGACWIGAFDVNQCMQILTLNETSYPVAIIPVGYESGRAPTVKKKTVKDIVIWD